jgi:hypothetical protein
VLGLEILRILRVLPEAEIYRRFSGPAVCVNRFRSHGRRSCKRSAADRLQLRRLIHTIDRRLPGGGNCLRRALVEIALDSAAATEPLHFGLNLGGGAKSGHAWLETDTRAVRGYDAVFTL